MQQISKFNKGFWFLLSLIDIYSKYTWVVSLKGVLKGLIKRCYEKGVLTNNAFQKILDEFNRKPNKIWVNKRSEFYNRSMELWLHYNKIEWNWTHDEGKP